MRRNTLKIAMLSTGEEVLHGDIDDTNASWLAKQFFDAGFLLHRRVTIGDTHHILIDEIKRCSQISDVVIVNGGLGPTTDDVTASAMACAMQTSLELNETWLVQMQAFFEKAGRVMPKSNIKQAMLPVGSEMIFNPIGTACGFIAKLNDCLFFFTPGVPKEFKLMVEKEILPRLVKEFGEPQKKQVQRFYTFGLSESVLNDKFSQISLPDECTIGYRSSMPFIEVKLFALKNQNLIDIISKMKAEIGEHLVGFNQTMLENVASLLAKNQKSLSLIETATAGKFTAWLNENEAMQSAVLQTKILPQNIAYEVKDPLEFTMELTKEAQKNASIGLACIALSDEKFMVVMTTEKGSVACELAFIRRFTKKEQQKYISAFMLNMIRRYLLGLRGFADASALEVSPLHFQNKEL